MSLQEILTAIDQLPEQERQQLYAEINAQQRETVEESPEETARIRAAIQKGIDAADRGDLKEWDFDDFIRRARERHAARAN